MKDTTPPAIRFAVGHLAPDSLSGEVHVWAVDLTAEPSAVDGGAGESLLSRDERARAERFRLVAHRRRFRASRIALRRILSLYTGVAPGELDFDYGALGKPALANRRLHFNLAHSGELALVAVTRDDPVGVDVERIRPSSSLPRIARRVLSAAERRRLEAVADAERPRAFYLAWTRKEALIKARGAGVFSGLERIEVTLRPGEPARLLALREEPVERWFLHDLRPAPGFTAAVAVEASRVGAIRRVRTWRWAG